MIEWFRQGGTFMWPILISSVWALGLMLERLRYYLVLRKLLDRDGDELFRISQEQGIQVAETRLQGRTGLLPDILRAAWDPAHNGISVAERSVEEVLHHYRPGLERHLSTLATLAGIQPLLGLLGTITGMIATFSVISAQGTGNAQALADGISEAMITTQAGLCAALPILLGHNFLRNRCKSLLSKLQGFCARALKERESHVTA